MFTVKTTHRVTTIDTRTAEISRETALWITKSEDDTSDRVLRERLFSKKYREDLKEHMRIYGGYNDYLHDEEVVSDDILSAEEE